MFEEPLDRPALGRPALGRPALLAQLSIKQQQHEGRGLGFDIRRGWEGRGGDGREWDGDITEPVMRKKGWEDRDDPTSDPTRRHKRGGERDGRIINPARKIKEGGRVGGSGRRKGGSGGKRESRLDAERESGIGRDFSGQVAIQFRWDCQVLFVILLHEFLFPPALSYCSIGSALYLFYIARFLANVLSKHNIG